VTVFTGGTSDESGKDELLRFANGVPDWAQPVVALKFDHRKLLVLDPRHILSALDLDSDSESDEDWEKFYPSSRVRLCEPRLTPSDNISMVKPTLDDWTSSQAAEADEIVLAKALGLPLLDALGDTHD